MRIILDGDSFNLNPELVRARIDGHVPEAVHDYWVEINGTRWPVKQVIALTTGVTDRQRFQSQSSRRWLRNLGFTIGKGDNAEEPAVRTEREASPRPTAATDPHPTPDLVLIGCVKTKLGRGAPAKDLYVSDYFTKMRRYAQATGLPWFILSAAHGLVWPDDWVEPYERYLPDTSHDYRRAWGQRTAKQLEEAVGPLAAKIIEIHAGAVYIDALRGPLGALGVRVVDRLQGLSIGHRLSWYLHHEDPRHDDQDVVTALRDAGAARTLTEVMATNGAGLRAPGMYSWWVDAPGAADLTRGLGQPVSEGLLYAGLAGATRSGGSTSSNTLWGRIATMHLGKKHEFSTLRRSLGSTLARAYDQPAIDEAQLTRWMYAHLRVVAIPVTDAHTLDALETTILAELDPPLNLAKVTRTPLRQRLSALRKQYGGAAAKEADHSEDQAPES